MPLPVGLPPHRNLTLRSQIIGASSIDRQLNLAVGKIKLGHYLYFLLSVDRQPYVIYNLHMIEVRYTDTFAKWVRKLRDREAARRVNIRIARMQATGNMGDVKFFAGIGELRIDYGPGYRVYFAKKGNALIVLLCGGDKSSQPSDIERAQQLAKEI